MTIRKMLCVKSVLNMRINLKRITIVKLRKVTGKKIIKNNKRADHEMQILKWKLLTAHLIR